ncbi:MAG TPA: acetone carboxylase subunit gamma [Solirubrobacterales bacterium]|nr:acetone carboxylase subunit gamma [Solirubrobacterales bacterium]
MKLDQDTLRDLIDEKLPRGQVRAIQSGFKDADRFDKYVEILQERVVWDDQIVLPFGEHLYIVKKTGPSANPSGGLPPGGYVVKCDCGHEFCEHTDNWKLEALINVRDSVESLREIYPDKMHGDPEWNSLREYFCPGCKTLLEVEAVPPGYPVIHDFVPDLEGFYEDWLGRPLP